MGACYHACYNQYGYEMSKFNNIQFYAVVNFRFWLVIGFYNKDFINDESDHISHHPRQSVSVLLLSNSPPRSYYYVFLSAIIVLWLWILNFLHVEPVFDDKTKLIATALRTKLRKTLKTENGVY